MNLYHTLHKYLDTWGRQNRMGWTEADLHETAAIVGHNIIDWPNCAPSFDFEGGREWQANATTTKTFQAFMTEAGDPHARFDEQVRSAPTPTPDPEIPVTWRKTRSGEWVVYGPADSIHPDTGILVTKKDGTEEIVSIGRIGNPFDVDGRPMRYGHRAPKTYTPDCPEQCSRCSEDMWRCRCR